MFRLFHKSENPAFNTDDPYFFQSMPTEMIDELIIIIRDAVNEKRRTKNLTSERLSGLSKKVLGEIILLAIVYLMLEKYFSSQNCDTDDISVSALSMYYLGAVIMDAATIAVAFIISVMLLPIDSQSINRYFEDLQYYLDHDSASSMACSRRQSTSHAGVSVAVGMVAVSSFIGFITIFMFLTAVVSSTLHASFKKIDSNSFSDATLKDLLSKEDLLKIDSYMNTNDGNIIVNKALQFLTREKNKYEERRECRQQF